ncbi:MAG: T9SS type A sorting domain-containing protein [Bacteroidetes bacterium]|nr:T9SS type A sorting domain-containing protein [Bacteroidota bacterium]
MKSFIKFFICGIFFFSLSSSFAQQGTMSTQALVFPDSSYLGYSDSTISVIVKNLDTSVYSGSISIWIGTAYNGFSPVQFCFIQQVTLLPNDTVSTACNIIFDTTNFTGGNNIVVVWSSGNAKTAADSIWTSVYLDSSGAGVHEILNSFSFSLHPSITSNYIHIEVYKQEITLEKIRILDIMGKEINSIALSQREKKNLVDVSNLQSGIYFLEVSAGSFRSTRKFVKID